ncbi:hypothetical protein MUN88_20365 [Gracilibacillus caseinilyticus]|uniref:Uncharacterized protein n=1 Tax=Gracilibacillus caseinilyticus TaxID=2932256 RepID=A0ABY4EVS1_9BACI|nr:hypothetical protein [Gracilibacillus caseinilyticus]UOQ48360.1 hypothetical protein MUN88_20365 [Gracilibacillus caseinilyticus]
MKVNTGKNGENRCKHNSGTGITLDNDSTVQSYLNDWVGNAVDMASVIRTNYEARKGRVLPIGTRSLALEIVAHVRGHQIFNILESNSWAVPSEFEGYVSSLNDRAEETHSGAYGNDRAFYAWLIDLNVDGILFG